MDKLAIEKGRVVVGTANSAEKRAAYENVNVEVTDFSSTTQFPFEVSAGLPGGDNCTDFASTPATFLALASTHGANNIKVASVEGFAARQTIRVDSGANLETAVIAQVGTPGAAKTDAALETGATVLHVSSTMGFNDGQTVTIGTGADAETATIAHTTSWAGTIALSAPLAHAYPSGTEVMGTGLSLTSPLNRDHARESQVTGNPPMPGAPNQYSAAAQ